MDFDKNRFRIKHCPCGRNNKDGKFAPFVGYNDKGYCHSCDRYFRTGEDTSKAVSCSQPLWQRKQETVKRISFMDSSNLALSQVHKMRNNFSRFLTKTFGTVTTEKLINDYYIGSSDHWPGATIFWQIDSTRQIRTGKVMLYDEVTGKRVKAPYSKISWIHKIKNIPDFYLRQCLFGEHLLSINPGKPVGIVESEKTAIIASACLPQFVWLATGGISNLHRENCKVLQGRQVTLFPDLNGYDKWQAKAEMISRITSCSISRVLQGRATVEEVTQGLDLADFLLREISPLRHSQ